MKISWSILNGTVKAPSSKSIMQRAIAISCLSKCTTTIHYNNLCDDILSALSIAKSLGKEIIEKENTIIIKGNIQPKSYQFNIGESGLGIRMFTPILASLNKECTIFGYGSIISRPIDMMFDPLKRLGVTIKSKNNSLPIKIKGPILSGDIIIDGSITSQFITGLLIVLPTLSENSNLSIVNATSKSYINLTRQTIEKFGGKIHSRNNLQYSILGNQQYKETSIKIEGDWSGASFFLVAGALCGKVSVHGLNSNSLQSDIKIIEILKMAGVMINKKNNVYTTFKSEIKPFEIDLTEYPDLFPPVATLASQSKGVCILHGINRLIYKESNRAETLKSEFAKIGITIELEENMMKIHGNSITGGEVNSHNDHRIAMSIGVLGCLSKQGIKIKNWQSIQKSYPTFFNDLKTLKTNNL